MIVGWGWGWVLYVVRWVVYCIKEDGHWTCLNENGVVEVVRVFFSRGYFAI
jgi:hypothetical protein